MALSKGDKANFKTLLQAAKNGDLSLLECRDRETNEYRAVICAVGFENGEYVMTPLGHLYIDNPYNTYIPPE